MTSHSLATADPSTAPSSEVRRSRKGLRLVLILATLLGVALATTACDPTLASKDAIEKYFGGNADCAERIAQR